MNKGGKIHELPGKPNEFLAAVESIKRNIQGHIEMAEVMADIRRAHYDAYIAKGFTKEQALDLCKKVTL